MPELLFDISKWNLFRDYDRLIERTAGGFVKASERLGADKLFKQHWAALGDHPKGAYHFWRPGVDQLAQAELFFETVNATGDLGSLPPVLDVEVVGEGAAVGQCAVRIQELFGVPPLIYTSQWGWQQIGNPPWGANFPLWVANPQSNALVRWSAGLAGSVRGQPALPSAWSDWRVWQFTFKGHGPDFGQRWPDSRSIDLNVVSGAIGDLRIRPPVEVGEATAPPPLAENYPERITLALERIAAASSWSYPGAPPELETIDE